MEKRIAKKKKNAKSDSVCDRANANCLRLFATLLPVYGKRSRICLEIESKCNLFQLKKERDNIERLISFTRNGETHIKREKVCSQALWPPNIN